MEKRGSVLTAILLITYLVVPLCSLLALFSSYSFSLWNYNSYAVLALLVSFIAAVAVLSRTAKSRKDIPLKSRIVIILLPLLVIINWICYIVLASFKTIVLCMPACFICTLIYMLKHIKHIKHKGWKIALAILYILILVPVCFILLLCLVFGNFGSRTVTETVYSPDGKYRAEVINNDMGALGGSTLVNVYNEQVLELYIIKISEKPQCIYEGAWSEYNDIKIIWTDNRTVLVNGKRHQLL